MDVFATQPGLVNTPLYDRTSPGGGAAAALFSACLRDCAFNGFNLQGSKAHIAFGTPIACLPAAALLAADKPGSWLYSLAARLLGQSPKRGAASLVYAAGATELDGAPCQLGCRRRAHGPC